MSTHTPGPWTAEQDGCYYIAGAIHGEIIAKTCDGRSLPNSANARLIAAAPDLLAALKTIARCGSIDDDWLVPVRAAIAKAEGVA